MQELPLDANIPQDSADLAQWQAERREVLRELVRYREYTVDAEAVSREQQGETHIARWKLTCDDAWTVPLVELSRGNPQETAVLFSAEGRDSLSEAIESALSQGKRVLVPDIWYFGECRPIERQYLFALVLQTVGERPLGVQASQLAALARWSQTEFGDHPVTLQSHGERTTQAAIIAAAPSAVSSSG